MKVPRRLFAEEFCSQSGCLFAQLALSAVPACLFKVMHAAVMAPFGSHIWPSVSVTVSGFSPCYPCRCEFTHNLPILVCCTAPYASMEVRGLQGTRVSFLVWYQLTLFPLYCLKKQTYALPLPFSSVYLLQKLAVHLGTHAES